MGASVIMWDFDNEDTLGATARKSEDLYDALAAKKPKNVLALNHSVVNSTAYVF